ncbi:hypothetical protein ABZ235_41015 [Streptomyces canus]|uniref:hypothetical protein n=1 Tax=Streptomyces canus TaxID=58343 RepID=UPI0033A105D8
MTAPPVAASAMVMPPRAKAAESGTPIRGSSPDWCRPPGCPPALDGSMTPYARGCGPRAYPWST